MSINPSENQRKKTEGHNIRGDRSVEIKAGEPCVVCHGVLLFDDAMRRRFIVPSCIGFAKIRVFDQPVKMDANYIAPSPSPSSSHLHPAAPPHQSGTRGANGSSANGSSANGSSANGSSANGSSAEGGTDHPRRVHMAMYGIGETIYTARLLDAGVFPMVTRGACLLAESRAEDVDYDDDDDEYDDDDYDDWEFEEEDEDEEDDGYNKRGGSNSSNSSNSSQKDKGNTSGAKPESQAAAQPKSSNGGNSDANINSAGNDTGSAPSIPIPGWGNKAPAPPAPAPGIAASPSPGVKQQDGGTTGTQGPFRAGSGYNNSGDAISGDRLIRGAADVAEGLGRAVALTARLSWAWTKHVSTYVFSDPLRARMQRDLDGFRRLLASTASRVPRDLRKLLDKIVERQ